MDEVDSGLREGNARILTGYRAAVTDAAEHATTAEQLEASRSEAER